MSDRFVSLAEHLRERPAAVEAPVDMPAEPPPCEETVATFAAARRFRAALADALDVAVGKLLEDVAASVLARELQLAPADVCAVVASALARYRDEEPLLVRAHPDEVASLAQCGMRVVADDGLRAGDVVLELKSGTIDATLGARLAVALGRA